MKMNCIAVIILFLGFTSALSSMLEFAKISKTKRGNTVCAIYDCVPTGAECFDDNIIPMCGPEGTNVTCFDTSAQCENEFYYCDCYEELTACFEKSTNHTCNQWGYFMNIVCQQDCNRNQYSCGPTPSPTPITECLVGNCEGGICAPLLSNGSFCYQGYQCESGYCNANQCEVPISPPPQQFPGDPCLANTDCIYNHCSGGICQGVSKGQPCNSSRECNLGLFCDIQGDCVPTMPDGHTCNSTEQCSPFSDCLLVNQTYLCLRQFGGMVGSPCPNGEGGSLCAMGLLCVNSVCIQPQINPMQPCEYLSDCISGWGPEVECVCNWNLGQSFCGYSQMYPAMCNSMWNSLMTCISKHGCVNTDLNQPNSCTSANCNNEIGCLLGCLIQDTSFVDTSTSCAASSFPNINLKCPSLTLGTTGTTATTAVSTGSTGTTQAPTTQAPTTGSHTTTGRKLTTGTVSGEVSTGGGATTGGTSKTTAQSIGYRKSASFFLVPLLFAIMFYL